MRYRPEIDGLRAVAVLPVILFHAGFDVFSGGFVGVDVFFVISGYLITTILITELSDGRFSLLAFYERRARRILPALFVVTLACVPFAWAWMMPGQLEDFALSVVAVALFVSNVVFWQLSGYFAPAAEEMPLLHTWSLAIEEQYYLAFPILLLVLWRYGRWPVVLTVLLAALASFAMAEWARREETISDAAVFYLLPFRAWELLIGSLCAFLAAARPQRPNDGLAAVGIAMIAGSILAFDHATPFPSAWTLVPVLGTALVLLFADGTTLVGRLLSAGPLVAIGLVSYSAYLWHQPLFAFARIRTLGEPAPALMLGLAVLSLVLACVTWRLVEQPFRRPSRGLCLSRRAVLAASAAGLALFVAVGAYGIWRQGFPGRMPPDVLAAFSFRKGDTSGCHNRFSAVEIASGERCVIGADDADPTLALLGDSHMGRLTDAFAAHLAARDVAAVTYNFSFCAPVVDFTTYIARRAGCRSRMNAAVEAVASDPDIHSVVLFAEWANYTKGGKIGDDLLVPYTHAPEPAPSFLNRSLDNNPREFEAAFRATVSELRDAGKTITIVYPTPAYAFSVPEFIARARLRQSDPELFGQDARYYKKRNAEVLAVFERAAADLIFETVDPRNVFCGPAGCVFADDEGRPLYEDGNHLSYLGSRQLVSEVVSTVLPQGETRAESGGARTPSVLR